MDINLLNTASDIGYIFLWIGLTILFLYLVFFFISLACVIDFNNKLKKRTSALMMSFSLFRDTFLALRDVLLEKKVSLSPANQELFYKDQSVGEIALALPGHHNLLNASAAIAAAKHIGIPAQESIAALKAFSGVKRRMEVKGVVRGVTVIDDFAHHPTAIAETIAALRGKMGEKGRIIAVLEPRSNTMKMGTMKDRLPGSLAGADAVICYADPKLGWDVQAALTPLGLKAHVYHSIEETAREAARLAEKDDSILVMSNGGFGGIHGKILSYLRN